MHRANVAVEALRPNADIRLMETGKSTTRRASPAELQPQPSAGGRSASPWLKLTDLLGRRKPLELIAGAVGLIAVGATLAHFL
jgi:hypothetical protein